MSDTSGADKFQKASTEAADVLLAILRTPDVSAKTRVDAARVMLSHSDLDVRLARLGKSLQKVPERGKWSLLG